ncbi:S24 family peptidase [Caulobacter sp. X]|uniref:LexA family transcriptional regulator n=1 Tax=Caulobacter sp. X TaxID=2048901 RepID=UPI000C14F653|nr:S24 family peptidase [Caulobacter sp. X]PIB96491.1 hypothetical protein CSW60_18455 [Caulobacter sp. X]
MLPRMDISDLPQRLERAGFNQAALARFMGLDPASLSKTIKGQRQLKAHEWAKIEEFFASNGGGETEGSVTAMAPRRRTPQSRIPVYGYAATGDDDRIAFAAGQVVDWLDPPPTWNGTGDLIAIRVLGDSMEPRLFTGEMVLAQVGLPPARDRDCIVEFLDGTALVKTYQGQKDGHVFLRQFNPDKQVALQATQVKALHAIIWRR